MVCYNSCNAGSILKERTCEMEHSDFDQFCQIKEIGQTVSQQGEKVDFISFLRYCAGRLDKGDSVQAIWNDYRVSEQ